MKRDNEYEIEGRVRFSEIDHRRRMTLPAIINYFQDCSIFQSEEGMDAVCMADCNLAVSQDGGAHCGQHLGKRF